MIQECNMPVLFYHASVLYLLFSISLYIDYQKGPVFRKRIFQKGTFLINTVSRKLGVLGSWNGGRSYLNRCPVGNFAFLLHSAALREIYLLCAGASSDYSFTHFFWSSSILNFCIPCSFMIYEIDILKYKSLLNFTNAPTL